MYTRNSTQGVVLAGRGRNEQLNQRGASPGTQGGGAR